VRTQKSSSAVYLGTQQMVALLAFFSRFGELKDSTVMRDKITSTSRGFGFVTFAHPASVDKVLSQGNLLLDGRKIDVKVAVPKEEMGGRELSGSRVRKIFVGGLLPTTTLQDLKDYFCGFGNIEEAVIMEESSTGRSRGFGFVTYDNEDSVEQVVGKLHTIHDKRVECKRAVPKKAMAGTGRGRPADDYGAYNGGYGGFGRARNYAPVPPPYGAFSYPYYPPAQYPAQYPPSQYPPLPYTPAPYAQAESAYAPVADAPVYTPPAYSTPAYSTPAYSGYGAARGGRGDRSYHPYR